MGEQVSDQHLRNVASLPCARCGIEGYSQAAHSNQSIFGKGRGLKASDIATFPLCCTRPEINGCHVEHDQLIGMTKDEANEREIIYLAKTLLTLYAAGKLKAVK